MQMFLKLALTVMASMRFITSYFVNENSDNYVNENGDKYILRKRG